MLGSTGPPDTLEAPVERAVEARDCGIMVLLKRAGRAGSDYAGVLKTRILRYKVNSR